MPDLEIKGGAEDNRFNTIQVIEFPVLVALDLIPGAVADSKLGTNTAIPSSVFILLSNVTSATNQFNIPTSPMQMQVVSSNANDTAIGTGAQQVTIKYLTQSISPSKFTEFTEIVTLNGTTPVNTVAKNIYRINDFTVNRTGIGLFSAGDISLQTVGGATTFEKIDVGTNRHRSAIHWIPNGKRTIVQGLKFSASTAGGVLFVLEQSNIDPSGNIVGAGVEQIEIASGSAIMPLPLPHSISNPNNKELFYAIAVKGRASNQSASGTFQFIDYTL